jgi:deazaflavin-dependent oxidoreductase (nitroreductase family)
MTEIDRAQLVADTAALDDFNREVTEEFRANGGKVAGYFEDDDVLLLHTTGAKSGKPRLSPLVYLTVDGKILIVGSYGGSPKDPAWVHNLRAHPTAHIEVGTESYDVDVRELAGEERDATFSKLVELTPVFAEHQTNAGRRTLPVFELTRV